MCTGIYLHNYRAKCCVVQFSKIFGSNSFGLRICIYTCKLFLTLLWQARSHCRISLTLDPKALSRNLIFVISSFSSCGSVKWRVKKGEHTSKQTKNPFCQIPKILYLEVNLPKDASWSLPFQVLSSVICLSTTLAPNATAPRVIVWPLSWPE